MQEPSSQYANKWKKENTWQQSAHFSAHSFQKVFIFHIPFLNINLIHFYK